MATIAVYSPKGGVGKTSLAVNLAWASATASARRTLLWDLDGQAGASFILVGDQAPGDEAVGVFSRDVDPARLIRQTATPRLDLLPSDASLRTLDSFFLALGKRKRLAKLLETLRNSYDRIILDCPPGLSATGEQIIRAADVIIAPMIPSPLSQRMIAELRAHLDRDRKGAPPLLPVFAMVDRRRALHRAMLAEAPEWPVIPMASAVEAMAERHAPLAAYAPSSPAATATAALWRAIEKRLAG